MHKPNVTNTNATPVTTATIPYIKGTSETIARILQPYNIRVAHKPITTLRQLLTNVKDKDEPKDRQGAVYKIKCCDCQATYIGETGRNLNVRLTEHRRATRNGDLNNNIAEHHLQTNHRIDWDSAECVTYSTNYYQRIVLESWFTNLEQTPLNRCLQLPAPYKRLVDDINNRQTTDWPTTTHGSKRTNHCLQQTNNRPTNFTNNTRTHIRLTKDGSKRTNHCVQSSQPMTTRLNWQSTNNITTSLTNHINDQSIYTTHWRYTNHLTLKMTSAQVVETSVNVTLNSPSQDYTHPDDRTPLSYDIGEPREASREATWSSSVPKVSLGELHVSPFHLSCCGKYPNKEPVGRPLWKAILMLMNRNRPTSIKPLRNFFSVFVILLIQL